MEEQYSWEKLNLEQLTELIAQGLGWNKGLQVAYQARLLMSKLPRLDFYLARLLVSSENDPGGTDRTDPIGSLVADALVDQMPFEKQLIEIRSMLSAGGQKVFDRAVRKYRKHPKAQAAEINALEMMQGLKGLPEDATGEQAKQKADEFAEDLEDKQAEDFRRILAEDYDITSMEDFARLIDARHCIAETQPKLLNRPGLSGARAFTKAALKLVGESRAKDCMPREIIEYRKAMVMVRNGTANPGSIINVPGSSQKIYGNGEPVRPGKDGKPRRTVIDIFGNEVAAGEQVDVNNLRDMVEVAFKNR